MPEDKSVDSEISREARDIFWSYYSAVARNQQSDYCYINGISDVLKAAAKTVKDSDGILVKIAQELSDFAHQCQSSSDPSLRTWGLGGK
jgi:hypothetical protein